MTELDVLRKVRKDVETNWWGGLEGVRLGTGGCLLVSLDEAAPASTELFIATANIVEREVGCGIPRFNDTHTHGEVLALLDTVIAKLEEQTYGNPLPELPVELTVA